MAKSLRSKREKRLRTLRREIAEPFYDKKDVAKLKALEAALAAPKLPVRIPTPRFFGDKLHAPPSDDNMITVDDEEDNNNNNNNNNNATTILSTDVEMAEGGSSNLHSALKPVGGVAKSKKNWKLRKLKRRHKGKKGKF